MKSDKRLNKLVNELDEKSKALVLYIWKKRCAKIKELRKAIPTPNDNYILTRIREVINPKAKEIFGKEILIFKESEINPATGEKELFSWWIDDEFAPEQLAPKKSMQKKMLDVFEEPESLKIIAELPFTGQPIKIDIEEKALIVSTNSYRRRIPLSCTISEILDQTYKNGVLELTLKK